MFGHGRSAWARLSLRQRVGITGWALLESLKPSAGALTGLPEVRTQIARSRWRRLSNSATDESSETSPRSVIKSTISHNSDPAWMFFPQVSVRPDLISLPLSCVDEVRQNAHRMKVLAIGARTEAEILSLATCGFQLRNVFALDLFSYSQTIIIGDASHLPFAEDSFDVIVLGWVLEFIPRYERALTEAIRVMKSGAILAVGAMHHPESMDVKYYYQTRQFDDRRWNPACSEQVESLVTEAGGVEVSRIFASGVQPSDRDKRGDVVSILRVFK